METNRLFRQIEFIKEIDKIKYIQRKTKLFNSDRHENDAEHSWHLSVMALILLEHANEDVDILKVVKMVLIHDIVEIDAGDTFLYDTSKEHINTIEERKAAERIFGILPKDQADDFIAVWEEFEAGETKEAKFAKTMDRLQPILQNASNEGGTWSEYNVPYNTVYSKVSGIKRGSETLWDYTENLLNEAREVGYIKK